MPHRRQVKIAIRPGGGHPPFPADHVNGIT